MNRVRLLASVLAASGLTGCIMLPLPPMPYRPPPTGFRGEGPQPPIFFGGRPPPPGWSACEADRAPAQQRCALELPSEPAPQPPGAR